MSELEIARVVEVFESVQASWALVGAHAIGVLTEPRATADFDFIVDGNKLPRILAGLEAVFGDLAENDIGAAIQLEAIDIDLIRSTNHPLFGEALAHRRTIGEWSVPSTEVLVALEFLAARNPWRDRKKRRQDILDIATIHEIAGSELDKDEMLRLTAMVYPGAEREFSELLAKLDRGDPITI